MTELFSRLAERLWPRYRLVRLLGSGGAAHVLVAEDVVREQQVAIKVLREELGTTVSAQRFLSEISVAAQLHHPNIVPLYGSGSVDGLPYYVMPLVEGESLRMCLTRVRQLALDLVLDITAEIGAALDYAHRQRVIHRDIKPENVMLGPDRAMVLDFGIALALDARLQRQTIPGLAPGTPEYMSPEQAVGDPAVDGRSDVYSLACVAYEMISGEPPFVGRAGTVIARQISADPIPLAERCSWVPRPVSNALARGLAKLPDERYDTPGAMVAALMCGRRGRGENGCAIPVVDSVYGARKPAQPLTRALL